MFLAIYQAISKTNDYETLDVAIRSLVDKNYGRFYAVSGKKKWLLK
jgi:hypothetical protein